MVHHIVQDFRVYLIEHEHLICILGPLPVFVEQINGSIQKGLPNRFSMIFYTCIYSISENVINNFVSNLGIFIHKSLLESFVNSTTSDFNRLFDIAHTLINIFQAVVSLILLTDLKTLFNWQMLVHSK
jgi:glucan phosphoethanolaminetransferase (alkaline phosphatase superfamily)